ncbi:alpha-1,2-mannosidase, putative subfamily [Metarhizium acridum CQMa 102]|uniref:Alpha-1,2-mannosidase, putative subfamily n=1 Tax=Metarhizium acridum (strain CQMa 102) TaxID=655827 RepID=E9E5Q1_METAQ|nr:alpha-1,2-mannosidase, putative subfamily [Metarhizium acridum CQMa 102]EFY88764.1 alpha-1,2-mannosidase, putative subfamily [Metarhizium acridum CQMa 102]
MPLLTVLLAISHAVLGSLASTTPDDAHFDVLDYVDPLIGTANGGHVFPGASLPYGMAKAVADVNKELQGGFTSNDGEITGFSHMHDSGTGGGASLGNFPLFPQTGCDGDALNNCYFPKATRASQRINGTVQARPGYFAVTMNTSVHAEMTVTSHTALYRFTFPTDGTPTKRSGNATLKMPYSPLILADLTDLADSRSHGSISVDAQSGRITGLGTFNPSFGIGTYNSYFCADFNGAEIRDTGVFMNNRAGTEPKSLQLPTDGNTVPGGAWVQFHPPQSNQIQARVGLSFISTERACNNAEAEIPDFNFKNVTRAAEKAWRTKLNVVKVNNTGVSKSLQRTFWSGVYRTMLSPQDYTGENPLWKSDEPYFDSYYCIWDSFRSTHPLLTLIDPHAQALMVRAMIDVYRHEGKLPDCRMSLCKGFTQGGSNADNVLADSYLKGLRDGIDWETGYEAVVSDAEVVNGGSDEPAIWTVEGRGGLHSWKTLGYIPTDDFDPYGVGIFTRSISRTVEYSYNDFCIAEMARDLNKAADAEKYLKRSTNWKNLFDPTSRSKLNTTGSHDPAGLVDSGFHGFLQPRYLNGSFGYQDPAICTALFNFTSCYLNPDGHETYEGGSWLYTFQVPHDQATLITMLGGAGEFVRRLEFLHNTPGLFYIGDEQSYLLLYLFHFVGKPGLSSHYAHRYIPSAFNDTLAGIPGNDDSGAMGSFTASSMMGLYPMSGQDVYLIIPPFFPEVTIRHPGTGKSATIRNVNFDQGYKNIYIQSARLNDRPYTKSWITHDFFSNGGVLELTLGPSQGAWGSGENDIPPSASTHFWK